ncbi:MAG: hypothetical protein AAF360_06110 [Pseudomonadota bacterium]
MSAFSDDYDAAMGVVLDVHADEMRWTRREGDGRLPPVAFRGAWTEPQMANDFEDPGVVAADSVIFVRIADFADRAPRKGDLIERDGLCWTVGRAEADGQGGLRLHMREGEVNDDA